MKANTIRLLLLSIIIACMWVLLCTFFASCSTIHKNKTVVDSKVDSTGTTKSENTSVKTDSSKTTSLDLKDFDLEITYDTAGRIDSGYGYVVAPYKPAHYSNSTIKNLHEVVEAVSVGRKVASVHLKIGSLTKQTDEHGSTDNTHSVVDQTVTKKAEVHTLEKHKDVTRLPVWIIITSILLLIITLIYIFRKHIPFIQNFIK